MAKKKIIRLVNKSGKPYYLNEKGKRAKEYDFLKQYVNKPKNLTEKEAKTFQKVKSNSRKGSQSERTRIGGKFVSNKMQKDLQEFANNHNVSLEDFVRQNQTDIEFYVENKAVDKSFTQQQLETLIKTYKYKIQVNYTQPVADRNELLSIIIDFKKQMIARKGLNIAEVLYFASIKEKGNVLVLDLNDIAHFLDSSDEDVASMESDNIKLIFSSKNKTKK